MRELWRKTFDLFKAHPVLWAPYAVAELLGFSLTKLRRMAIYPLMRWLSTTTTRSVLGGKTETFNVDTGYHRTILLGGLLGNGTHYVNVCLLTLALVLTAVLALAFLRAETADRSGIVAALRPNAKGILLFALKFCVVFWVLSMVFVWPLGYLTKEFPNASGLTASLLLDGESLLVIGCIAWIMAPLAVALVHPQSTPPVDAVQKNRARYFALLTILATSILRVVVNRIDSNVPASSGMETTAISALARLVINAPMAMLFTLFALIAWDQAPEGESGSGFDLRQIANGVMQPHFPPDEEPGPVTEP